MPIFQLNETIIFPNPNQAEPDGLLAFGGDLNPLRLLEAYNNGIFPWFSDNEPILWWSPNPRFVLFPEKLNISKSMKSLINQNKFKVTYNQCFEQVISNCKKAERNGQSDTWITSDMQNAYIQLHKMGIAHSVEVWENKQLVGGLYGIQLHQIFCGESMFSLKNNASKYGFISFVEKFKSNGGKLIDCQVYTAHLESLGAEEISRNNFLELLYQYK